MNKAFFLLVCTFVVCVCAAPIHYSEKEDDMRETYATWVAKHRKLGVSQERYEIFVDNLKFINRWNAFKGIRHNYTVGLNKFADLTHEEFRNMHTGCYMKHHGFGKVSPANATRPRRSAPSSIDWRDNGAVTAPKDQGQCGSCWSFSTTGSIEGAWAIAKGLSAAIPLSEQQLIDCSKKNAGCNGGEPSVAIQYVMSVKGLVGEEDYPYTAAQGTCSVDFSEVVSTVSSVEQVTPSGDEDALMAAAAQQPIAVGIDASHRSFQVYTDGVYDEAACSSSDLDHAVLVVGYGTGSDGDYWIVKNSWGSDWGESGFIRMSRNKSNQCGIATDPCYPVI